jgi:hypothetical protein
MLLISIKMGKEHYLHALFLIREENFPFLVGPGYKSHWQSMAKLLSSKIQRVIIIKFRSRKKITPWHQEVGSIHEHTRSWMWEWKHHNLCQDWWGERPQGRQQLYPPPSASPVALSNCQKTDVCY